MLAWAERNTVWLFPPRGDTEISEDTLLLQSHHLSQNNNSQHFNSISHSQFLHDSEKMNGVIGIASSCKEREIKERKNTTTFHQCRFNELQTLTQLLQLISSLKFEVQNIWPISVKIYLFFFLMRYQFRIRFNRILN